MRILIIEDAEIDRLNLRTLLEDHGDVDIVGEAPTLDAAVELLDEEQPDAVFLDIHLGRQKGFKALELAERRPLVVITTSHPHYAIKGYEVGAVDYLLKPVSEEPLARALTRLRERLAAQEQGGGLDPDDMQSFKVGDDRHMIRVRELQAIVGERVYTRVLVRDGREFLHNRPLREWRFMLPRKLFRALDRSTIVNVTEVKMVRLGDDGVSQLIFQSSGHRLALGAVALKKLRTHINV